MIGYDDVVHHSCARLNRVRPVLLSMLIDCLIIFYSASAAMYLQLCPASRLSRQLTRRRRYVAPSHFILVHKNHLFPEACCFPLIAICNIVCAVRKHGELRIELSSDCVMLPILYIHSWQ